MSRLCAPNNRNQSVKVIKQVSEYLYMVFIWNDELNRHFGLHLFHSLGTEACAPCFRVSSSGRQACCLIYAHNNVFKLLSWDFWRVSFSHMTSFTASFFLLSIHHWEKLLRFVTSARDVLLYREMTGCKKPKSERLTICRPSKYSSISHRDRQLWHYKFVDEGIF